MVKELELKMKSKNQINESKINDFGLNADTRNLNTLKIIQTLDARLEISPHLM